MTRSLHRMNALAIGLLITLILSACTYTAPQSNVRVEADKDSMPVLDSAATKSSRIDSLVTTEWLAQHQNDPDLIILDANVIVKSDGAGGFQSISGQENYTKAHIPNAVFADIIEQLSDPSRPGQIKMPEAGYFANQMGQLGVGDGSRVVIYDRSNSAWAARVWWMLRWVGFDNAALLDGGFTAWQAEGRPVSSEPAILKPNRLSISLRPELIADQQEVRAAIDHVDVHIIDALPSAHYSGQFSLYGKPGHIPSASNVPASSLHSDSGHFLPEDELSSLFESDQGDRTITYCGGGISAAADAFVLHRLGYKDVALYAGSLSDWVENPDNPLVTESDDSP